ncbi:MAG: DUF362 domain-containing protein [Candidatus Sumerlaeia bacterium]
MTSRRIARREFIARSARAGLSLAGMGFLGGPGALAQALTSPALQPASSPTPVASPAGPSPAAGQGAAASRAWVVEFTAPAQGVRKAIELAGGMGRFVSRGDRVVLKPNMGWARPPELAANTNPDVMAELTRLCLEAGAKEVLITEHTCNTAQRCYAMSGIAQACESAGAKVLYTRDSMFRKHKVGGEFLKEWEVTDLFLECDKIINVPVAKHHGLSRVTIGMKNWMGAIGGNRGRLHQNIHVAVVDLAAFFKPVLTVVDCTRVLMSGGPSSGDPNHVRRLNRIVVSADPVAADSLAAEFLGARPAELPFLQNARMRGLGEWERSRIAVETVKV